MKHCFTIQAVQAARQDSFAQRSEGCEFKSHPGPKLDALEI